MWDTKDYQTEKEQFITTSTDKPGFHKIEKIPVGYYHVMSIDEPGYALFQQTDILVEKDSPKTINCLLSKGGVIQGQVVNEHEEPVGNIPISIESSLYTYCKELKTDENGRFYAEYLPDMRYSAIAEPPSESQYATTVFRGDVTCGQKDIKIIVKNKKETRRKTSLVGEKLPQLDGIKIDLDKNQIKNNRLLICFKVEMRHFSIGA